MATGTFPDVSAYIPIRTAADEAELNARKERIIQNIPGYPRGVSLNRNAIENTTVDRFFNSAGNLLQAASDYQILKQIRSDVMNISAQEREIDPITRQSLAIRYDKAAESIRKLIRAFDSLGAHSQTEQALAEEYRLMQNPFMNVEPVELTEYMAKIDPDYLGFDGNGKFTISLPPCMMYNRINIRACFEIDMKITVGRLEDGSWGLSLAAISARDKAKLWGSWNESRNGSGSFTRSRSSSAAYAPHINSNERICFGENERHIIQHFTGKRYAEGLAHVLNSFDLYNPGSPFRAITEGLGGFDAVTGEWGWSLFQSYIDGTRIGYILLKNRDENSRITSSALSQGKNYFAMREKSLATLAEETPATSNDHAWYVPANGSINEFETERTNSYRISKKVFLNYIKSRVPWHQAISHIGIPRRDELYIETGINPITDIKPSFLGVGEYGFRVYNASETQPSSGIKIILKEDWFDLAFRELSLLIEKKLRSRPIGHSIVFNREPIVDFIPEGQEQAGGLSAIENVVDNQPRPTGRVRKTRATNAEAEANARALLESLRAGAPIAIAQTVVTGTEVPDTRRRVASSDEHIIEVGVIDTNEQATTLPSGTTVAIRNGNLIIDTHGHTVRPSNQSQELPF